MDKIRVAVIGAAGGRARWFVQEVTKNANYELVSVVDHLKEAANLVVSHHELGNVSVFADTSEALDRVDCDAIIVATHDSAHIEPTLNALERDLFVFVEKPLSTTLMDCVAIIEADEKVGGKTMVGFNLRFAPFYRKMKQLAGDGSIGRLLTIQADEYYHGGRTYFRRWNRLKRIGGGLWITKACHDFDLLYWIAGRLPVSVDAFAELSHFVPRNEAGQRCRACSVDSTCVDSSLSDEATWSPLQRGIAEIREKNGWPARDLCLYNSDKDTFDHGIVKVRFPDGLLGVYTVNVVSPISDRRMRVSGSEGMIEGSLSVPEVALFKRDRKLLPPDRVMASYPDTASDGGHGGGDSKLLNDFAAFIRGQTRAPVSPAEASVAVALGVAATISGETRNTVPLSSLDGWSAIADRLIEADATQG